MRGALPPGPPYPSLVQGIGFWTRPRAFLERCRARYGKRFTIRLPVAPPFVMLSSPAEVKEAFTAPPDLLHPGEGARILEPLVGTHSVILLDAGAHMEQRKLMLPAFHGESMARLSGLMVEVAEREVASWPRNADRAASADAARPERVLASEAALSKAAAGESAAWNVTDSAVLRGRSVATGVAHPVG